MARRIKKVSYDGHKVLVRWEIPKRGEFEGYELESPDVPAPSFLAALQALRTEIATICELPATWCADLDVRGVTCSYGGDKDTLSVTITALKHVATANAPLVLNTPNLPAEPYNDTDDSSTPVLEESTEAAVLALAAEACRYLEGHRAQSDLFPGGPGAALAPDAQPDTKPRKPKGKSS